MKHNAKTKRGGMGAVPVCVGDQHQPLPTPAAVPPSHVTFGVLGIWFRGWPAEFMQPTRRNEWFATEPTGLSERVALMPLARIRVGTERQITLPQIYSKSAIGAWALTAWARLTNGVSRPSIRPVQRISWSGPSYHPIEQHDYHDRCYYCASFWAVLTVPLIPRAVAPGEIPSPPWRG